MLFFISMVNYLNISAEKYYSYIGCCKKRLLTQLLQKGRIIMANNSYAGAGVSLSSTYYLRNFYRSNRNVISAAQRSSYSKSELSYEDAAALRHAVNKLGSFSYSDDDSENIRNNVKAFVDTYNNLLSSSDSTDNEIKHAASQLKSLSKQYSDELDKVGITVNSDGSLTRRDSLIETASLSKFKTLFSSDSDYMKKVSSYAKRLQNRSNELVTDDLVSAARSKKTSANSQSASSDEQTAAAAIVDEALGLEMMQNAGIGNYVNLAL